MNDNGIVYQTMPLSAEKQNNLRESESVDDVHGSTSSPRTA
jgi:hypothetical protein